MLLLSTYQTLPNLAFCFSSNKRIKGKLQGFGQDFQHSVKHFKNLKTCQVVIQM